MAHDNASRKRPQKAVHWKASGYDTYGQVVVDAPEEINVRIEKGITETLDPQGHTVASLHGINVPKSVETGSILWLGEMKDLPDTPTNLLQVINYDEAPDLKARKFDRWVQVMEHSDTLPTVDPASVVVPPPDPTPVGTSIWKFVAGDSDFGITTAEWDAYVAALPANAEVPANKEGDNSVFLTFGTNSYRLHAPFQYQVPELLGSGEIWCDRETTSKHITHSGTEQTHCQWAPRGVSGTIWKDNFYLGPNRRYKYILKVDLDEGGTTTARWKSITNGAAPDPGNFCILMDLHPGTFTAPWSGSLEPPIGLYILDGKFKFFVRGGKGAATDYTKINSADWTFAAGTHTFEMEWEVLHDATLGILPQANVLIKDDNIERANFTQEVGIPGGGSDAGALVTKLGVYGSRTSVAHDSFEILVP